MLQRIEIQGPKRNWGRSREREGDYSTSFSSARHCHPGKQSSVPGAPKGKSESKSMTLRSKEIVGNSLARLAGQK